MQGGFFMLLARRGQPYSTALTDWATVLGS
jgi:hypothetical protein